jgi:ADP-heptose:LPS heptosyltransferase
VKILVIKPSSLGDIVHGLRIVHQVHQILPDIRIDWVVKKGLEDILFASGLVEKIYLFERGGGFLSYIRLIKKIRNLKYDYVLDLQGLLRSAVLTATARSKNKFGVADGRELSTFFYSCIGEKCRQKQLHAIDRLVPFLEKIGVANYNATLPLEFKNSTLNGTTRNKLAKKKYILLFPESRRLEKVWPFFNELSYSLLKKKNFLLVVAGNYQDKDFLGSIDLRGKLKLSELPELIRGASVVVTNDSAPLHIASALGTSTVALFGPTEEEKYGPYPLQQKSYRILTAPDGQMKSIALESVIYAVDELTETKPKGEY